jgi:type II secretory pathway predicted ATPase ExeA
MIDKIQQHFGFTQMPFGRDLTPATLHRHAAHAQAAARITWTITEKTLGVITGEVGTGKTVAARAALAALDPTRHTVIYIGNPATGVRGIHHHIVTSLGGRPAHGTATLTAQAYDVLAGEAAERGRTPVLIIDLCRHRNYADGRRCHLLGGWWGGLLPVCVVGIVTGFRGRRGWRRVAGSGQREQRPEWWWRGLVL